MRPFDQDRMALSSEREAESLFWRHWSMQRRGVQESMPNGGAGLSEARMDFFDMILRGFNSKEHELGSR